MRLTSFCNQKKEVNRAVWHRNYIDPVTAFVLVRLISVGSKKFPLNRLRFPLYADFTHYDFHRLNDGGRNWENATSEKRFHQRVAGIRNGWRAGQIGPIIRGDGAV